MFGIHGVGGIVGAIGTGVFCSAALGGIGYGEGVTMLTQVWIQIQAVVLTIVWCGVGSAALFLIVKAVFGLRPSETEEREGLDISAHGERAYDF